MLLNEELVYHGIISKNTVKQHYIPIVSVTTYTNAIWLYHRLSKLTVPKTFIFSV